MNVQDDWRLLNQEEYLFGVTLTHEIWRAKGRNDHDHCAFCWAKFADFDGCLHEGWCTEDRYHWICDICYQDFRERFKWSVKLGV